MGLVFSVWEAGRAEEAWYVHIIYNLPHTNIRNPHSQGRRGEEAADTYGVGWGSYVCLRSASFGLVQLVLLFILVQLLQLKPHLTFPDFY